MGMGMSARTLERLLFEPGVSENWHMQASERSAMIHILDTVKPDVSIEVGTFMAGSLRPIAAASREVHTFDIDRRIYDGLPNVTFHTGDSSETLPPVIHEINESNRELDFVLIDGDHSELGVRKDIISVLQYRPKTRPTVIVMHDSSNPAVRKGIAEAPWNDCPYVHEVNLDFVPGVLYSREDLKGQIWGGLATAILTPAPREGYVNIQRPFEASLQAMLAESIYN